MMGNERGRGLILRFRFLNISLNIKGHPNGDIWVAIFDVLQGPYKAQQRGLVWRTEI